MERRIEKRFRARGEVILRSRGTRPRPIESMLAEMENVSRYGMAVRAPECLEDVAATFLIGRSQLRIEMAVRWRKSDDESRSVLVGYRFTNPPALSDALLVWMRTRAWAGTLSGSPR